MYNWVNVDLYSFTAVRENTKRKLMRIKRKLSANHLTETNE